MLYLGSYVLLITTIVNKVVFDVIGNDFDVHKNLMRDHYQMKVTSDTGADAADHNTRSTEHPARLFLDSTSYKIYERDATIQTRLSHDFLLTIKRQIQ